MNKEQQELYDNLLKKVNEYCLGFAAEDIIENIDALVDTYENSIEKALKETNDLKLKVATTRTACHLLKRDLDEAKKALKIIKKRECIFKGLQVVTQEEYELLKEILK